LARRTALRIETTFRPAGRDAALTDTLAVQVWPRAAAPAKWTGPKVALIDSTGETAAALGKLGVPFVRVTRDAIDRGWGPKGTNLLVVGRNSYGEMLELLKERFLVLDGATEAGLNVVVLAQLHRRVMGLRSENVNLRQVFVRDPGHPLLAGLGNADFHDWRGAAGSLPPYEPWNPKRDWWPGKYSKHGQKNAWGQRRFWHWSNKGTVATFAYEKPQLGNFRVLLDGGFDQLHTPLIEFRRGRGRVLLSQLEMVPRVGTDPVATLLLGRIVRHYAKPHEPWGQPVGCLSEDADRLVRQRLRLASRAGLNGPVVLLTAKPLGPLYVKPALRFDPYEHHVW